MATPFASAPNSSSPQPESSFTGLRLQEATRHGIPPALPCLRQNRPGFIACALRPNVLFRSNLRSTSELESRQAVSGRSPQDRRLSGTRATALRERFFAYGETAVASSPALDRAPRDGLSVPWKDVPGTSPCETLNSRLTSDVQIDPGLVRIGAWAAGAAIHATPTASSRCANSSSMKPASRSSFCRCLVATIPKFRMPLQLNRVTFMRRPGTRMLIG